MGPAAAAMYSLLDSSRRHHQDGRAVDYFKKGIWTRTDGSVARFLWVGQAFSPAAFS